MVAPPPIPRPRASRASPALSARGSALFLLVGGVLALSLVAGAGCGGDDAIDAERLAFESQPPDLTAGEALGAITVLAVDESGRRETARRRTIGVELRGPDGETLSTLSGESASGRATLEGPVVELAGAGFRLVAASEGLDGAESEPFEVRPAEASALSFLDEPASAVAGAQLFPVVRVGVQDRFGNLVDGDAEPPAAVTIALAEGAADELGGKATVAAEAGVARFDGLRVFRARPSRHLVASTTGLDPVTSDAFPVAAGAPHTFRFLELPVAAVSGVLVAPEIAVGVVDAWENPVDVDDLAVDLFLDTPGGIQPVYGRPTAFTEGGVARFDKVAFGPAGPAQRLVALATGLLRASSDPFPISPGKPLRLVFVVPPTPRLPGEAFDPPVEVEVLDGSGNLVESAEGEISLALEGGSDEGQLAGQTTAAIADGRASFEGAYIGEPGNGYRLVATYGGLFPATSATFSVYEHSLDGTLTYDRVPVKIGFSKASLDYGKTTIEPIRRAHVELVESASGLTVAESSTDDEGAYRLAWAGTMDEASIRVCAEILDPPIRVEDNTDGDALHCMASAPFDPALAPAGTGDLHAASGWTGESYGEPRVAAPFAILDTALGGMIQILAAGRYQLPPLVLNWSVNNRPEEGSTSAGQIGRPHWNGSEIFLLGAEDIDTSEYDVSTVLHEMGHYVDYAISRPDSIAGSHGIGDTLDPRVALSEGFADGLAGVLQTGPATLASTHGKRQSKGWYLWVDDNVFSDLNSGWFSEFSVMAIVYDMTDSEGDEDEPWDSLHLPLGDLLDVMRSAMVATDALNTIFSFVAGFKDAYPEAAEPLDELAGQHALDPVVDAWGTGETHTSGSEADLPVYRALAIGGTEGKALVRTVGVAASDHNPLRTNRYFRFVGNGGRVRITAEPAGSVDLFLFRRGELVGYSLASSGQGVLTTMTEAGASYVIVLHGSSPWNQTYEVGVRVEEAP